VVARGGRRCEDGPLRLEDAAGGRRGWERESGDRKSSEHAAADGRAGAVAPSRVLTLFCHRPGARVQPVHAALDNRRRDQRTQQAQATRDY
jgi:hypothetical protein